MDYYARSEGKEAISSFYKAVDLATMITAMRPDIDNIVDDEDIELVAGMFGFHRLFRLSYLVVSNLINESFFFGSLER
ncbi:hypothetical protein FRX31_027384 [Thalictrum thalictroides]|uniref:Uncharacterized protein n=1 Tax=Thalictrum thalictroides TaxID=46969 RepID=A0A7J6VD38_THATH|nr:hypothetical protein FRX31_027384 [Thalictrum thalictroides]